MTDRCEWPGCEREGVHDVRTEDHGYETDDRRTRRMCAEHRHEALCLLGPWEDGVGPAYVVRLVSHRAEPRGS
jgi:hypothetical protein